MPRQYQATRERSKEWSTPTADELGALGLMDQEIDYALQIWPSLLNSYFEVIQGNPAGFDELESLAPDLAEGLAGSIDAVMALGQGEYELPEGIKERIGQMRERSLERFSEEMGRIRDIAGEERAEEYARAIGPGYATSTPFAQAQALYEREFQPAYAKGMSDILQGSDKEELGQRQFYSKLGADIAGQRLGAMGGLYSNVLGQSSARREQELQNIMGGLPLMTYPTGLRQAQAQAYAPFRMEQATGAGGSGGRVSSGGSGGGILGSAMGGALSAFGKGVGGPVGGSIGKVLGGIFD